MCRILQLHLSSSSFFFFYFLKKAMNQICNYDPLMNSKMNRSEILHQSFVTPSVRINYNNWKPKEAVGSFDAKKHYKEMSVFQVCCIKHLG